MATAQHLELLKMKHADLEAKIADEEGRPHPDDEIIHELKKQKLRIKDQLAGMERVHA